MLYSCVAKADTSDVSGYEVTTQRGIVQPSVPTRQEKINVNTASAQELESLWGIGEVKAQAIVAYREGHGPFSCPEDLLEVSGIGTKTLEKIRDDITWEVIP